MNRLFLGFNELENIFRKHTKVRKIVMVVTIILLFINFILYIISDLLISHLASMIDKALPPILIVLAILLLSCISSFRKYENNNTIEQELLNIKEEREKIQERLQTKSNNYVLDTIQLSLNQITEYYTINKNQAKKSFAYSFIAIVIGFVTIIVGIWFYYSGKSNLNITIISGISGILVEFIGAANFYMYNKSSKQLNYFFNKLEKMQYVMLCIKLCDDFQEPNKKDEIKEKIITSCLSFNVKN